MDTMLLMTYKKIFARLCKFLMSKKKILAQLCSSDVSDFYMKCLKCHRYHLFALLQISYIILCSPCG